MQEHIIHYNHANHANTADVMLTSEERKILEIIDKRLLITENELVSMLRQENVNGGDHTIRKLRDWGFIERVHSLGTCIVITQKGMRALKVK